MILYQCCVSDLFCFLQVGKQSIIVALTLDHFDFNYIMSQGHVLQTYGV